MDWANEDERSRWETFVDATESKRQRPWRWRRIEFVWQGVVYACWRPVATWSRSEPSLYVWVRRVMTPVQSDRRWPGTLSQPEYTGGHVSEWRPTKVQLQPLALPSGAFLGDEPPHRVVHLRRSKSCAHCGERIEANSLAHQLTKVSVAHLDCDIRVRRSREIVATLTSKAWEAPKAYQYGRSGSSPAPKVSKVIEREWQTRVAYYGTGRRQQRRERLWFENGLQLDHAVVLGGAPLGGIFTSTATVADRMQREDNRITAPKGVSGHRLGNHVELLYRIPDYTDRNVFEHWEIVSVGVVAEAKRRLVEYLGGASGGRDPRERGPAHSTPMQGTTRKVLGRVPWTLNLPTQHGRAHPIDLLEDIKDAVGRCYDPTGEPGSHKRLSLPKWADAPVLWGWMLQRFGFDGYGGENKVRSFESLVALLDHPKKLAKALEQDADEINKSDPSAAWEIRKVVHAIRGRGPAPVADADADRSSGWRWDTMLVKVNERSHAAACAEWNSMNDAIKAQQSEAPAGSEKRKRRAAIVDEVGGTAYEKFVRATHRPQQVRFPIDAPALMTGVAATFFGASVEAIGSPGPPVEMECRGNIRVFSDGSLLGGKVLPEELERWHTATTAVRTMSDGSTVGGTVFPPWPSTARGRDYVGNLVPTIGSTERQPGAVTPKLMGMWATEPRPAVDCVPGYSTARQVRAEEAAAGNVRRREQEHEKRRRREKETAAAFIAPSLFGDDAHPGDEAAEGLKALDDDQHAQRFGPDIGMSNRSSAAVGLSAAQQRRWAVRKMRTDGATETKIAETIGVSVYTVRKYFAQAAVVPIVDPAPPIPERTTDPGESIYTTLAEWADAVNAGAAKTFFLCDSVGLDENTHGSPCTIEIGEPRTATSVQSSGALFFRRYPCLKIRKLFKHAVSVPPPIWLHGSGVKFSVSVMRLSRAA